MTLSTSLSARLTTSLLRMSPTISSASSGKSSGRSRSPCTCSIRLSRTRTSLPRLRSSFETARPMNPAPPVTSTLSPNARLPDLCYCYAVSTTWLLLHQPISARVCSRAGSFRRVTNRGFEPSRGPRTFKTMLKPKRIAIRPKREPLLFRTIGNRCCAEPRLPEAEGRVSEPVEIEQHAIDGPAGQFAHRAHEPLRSLLIKIKFDDRSGAVPRHVLAPDQIVRLVMVDRIALDQRAGARA